MHELALRSIGLCKRYDDVIAVDGLDLEVWRGECFALLGPNGAGKTTTVEIFEGLLKPDAGDVEVLGSRWQTAGRALRERLGIQLQETQLADKISVLETIRLFRSFYRSGPTPGEVLEMVGLGEKRDAWVRKLSGGQKQRLSLACALVGDPDVLFLDEPTTGLDPQSRRRIWQVVAALRARGRTVLLTTHYMEEAERLCDRVAIIDRGRVIALGTPRELIASLGAEHVIEFESSRPVEVDLLRSLPGIRDVAEENGAMRLTVSQVHQSIPALLAELARREIELTRLATHHATLEDVFVSMTGRHLRDE
ncbi:MAG TPA: ABC transporter ATP-binding protein [Candidatus Polarisedimenticolaceae bacterium]|nr:ABC transporter ATP-binding protein [Candidatus Polarisedimenticolaceae bacterium]